VQFILNESAALRPQEGGGPIYDVPAGIALPCSAGIAQQLWALVVVVQWRRGRDSARRGG